MCTLVQRLVTLTGAKQLVRTAVDIADILMDVTGARTIIHIASIIVDLARTPKNQHYTYGQVQPDIDGEDRS